MIDKVYNLLIFIYLQKCYHCDIIVIERQVNYIMLLSKTAEYKVNARKISYYRDLGYKCKAGDIITVPIEQLHKNASSLVKYQCDRCGCILEVRFVDFCSHHKIDEKTYCVKCSNEIRVENYNADNEKYLAHNGYKLCPQCNRVLPANLDYFFKHSRTKDGLNKYCKECRGKHFTDNLTHIPKDGYKFCKKCKKELPANNRYFPTDNYCKDGLRNVCYECNNKYGKYLNKIPVHKEPWSKKEIDLLIKTYPYYTNEEISQQFLPNRTIRAIESMAYIYHCNYKTQETINRIKQIVAQKNSAKLSGRKISDETKMKLSKSQKIYYQTHSSPMKGKKLSPEQIEQIRLRNLGRWSGKKNPRYINPLNGDKNPNWKGGTTGLYYELRSDTKQWKEDSMKFCDYKCVITGSDFNNIHHQYPFKDIVEETFDILKLDIKSSVSEYSTDEMNKIKDTVKNLHQFYGYGATLNGQIHRLFHNIYGYKNVSLNDFLDFIKRIEQGEFDNWFKLNNLSININYKYIKYLQNIKEEVS